MDAIKTTCLTKNYGSNRGIEQLSLRVEQGAFFGFIGPNGAGKSTTIRVLLGLIRPTGGEAQVLGLEVGSAQKEILSRVGYLPSEAAFHPGMQVRDVLNLSAALRRKDCTGAAAQLCERLKLEPAQKVEELSFGNRKKVGIVCALQHNPELLILDEPTSGLDPLMQKEFFAILRERNQAGATVFLSSHILSEIQRNCTHAAMIREGKLIACSRVDALVKSNVKRVHLSGAAALDGLPGVRNLQKTGDSATFLYHGDIHALLAVLARGNICDLSVTEPDLEEQFMHWYGEGGAAQ